MLFTQPQKKNHTRYFIEGVILARVKTYNPNNFSAEKPMVYVSLGSGGLLQDFIILTNIIQLGLTHLEVHLIDNFYGGYNNDKQRTQFNLLQIAAKQQGGSFNATYHSNLDGFLTESPNTIVHVACLIGTAITGGLCIARPYSVFRKRVTFTAPQPEKVLSTS